MNGYELSRQWFDFAFENPSIVKPTHGVVYLWVVELANRMGWAKEFANPGSQAMAATGIKSYNTYKGVLDDLVEWGFIQILKPSVNQYQACIIALSKFENAHNKALDKALTGHVTNHLQSTVQSTDSINKPETSNKEPKTLNPQSDALLESFEKFWGAYGKKKDRKKCYTAWKNLTQTKRNAVLENVALYVKANPDEQYRKNPLTYLNGECWEDELPVGKPVSNYQPKKSLTIAEKNAMFHGA